MGSRFSLVLASLASLAASCASPASPKPRTAEPPRSERALPAAPARPEDTEWGAIRVPALALELALPEANSWQEQPPGAWVRFRHEPSESALEIRLERAARLARPEDCEARTRLERPDLPAPSDEQAVDRRRLTAPAGFVTELTVSVESGAENGGVVGHALAFGARVGRCLAFHFVTRAEGPGAEAEIARRLGLAVERILPTLRLLGVEDRVRPEPPR